METISDGFFLDHFYLLTSSEVELMETRRIRSSGVLVVTTSDFLGS